MRYATSEGYYSITPMPNQPSVALCYDFTVLLAHRGQRAAHRLKAHQMNQLKLLHYTIAVCTTQESNEAQTKVLLKAGWIPMLSFKDARSGTNARMWQWVVS